MLSSNTVVSLIEEHPYIVRTLFFMILYYWFKELILTIVNIVTLSLSILMLTLCIIAVIITARGDTERFDTIVEHVLNGTRSVAMGINR